MKIVTITTEDDKIEYLVISYKFKGLKNIVVSNKKIYQLPCQIGKRTYPLKEIKPDKNNLYWIESKPYSVKQLKNLIYKRKIKFKLCIIPLYPF